MIKEVFTNLDGIANQIKTLNKRLLNQFKNHNELKQINTVLRDKFTERNRLEKLLIDLVTNNAIKSKC